MSAQDKISAIESAMKRAASAATHGSRQIKSGQLDPEIEPQREMIKLILAEAQAAYAPWAHYEAMKLASKEARDGLNHLELDDIRTISRALVRDAMSKALRLSEPAASDKITLCNIAKWLENDAVCSRLASEQWALDLGNEPHLASDEAKLNGERLSRFKECVPARWPKEGEPRPTNPKLMELRDVLVDVRHTRLAHYLTRAPQRQPDYDEIRDLVNLTLDLSTDMAFVLIGPSMTALKSKTTANKQAEKFWSACLRSPVETYRQDVLRKERPLSGFAEDPE